MNNLTKINTIDETMLPLVQHAMNMLIVQPVLATFVQYFNDPAGFAWSSDPRIAVLFDLIDTGMHSGSSFAICMRYCQSLYNGAKYTNYSP
jgi:hypothetical protein